MTSELILKAEKLKLNGEHLDAIGILEDIVKSDLNCIAAFEELGDNFLSLRQFDKALRALKYALRLDPISANAHYLLGFTFSCLNQFDKSIAELEIADKIEPNHPEIVRCLGWSIFNAGKKKQGLVILNRANALAPNDPLIMCDLGVCLLNDMQFEAATKMFEKILTIEPGNHQALECLKACSHFKQKHS